jgi:hypothetical protein
MLANFKWPEPDDETEWKVVRDVIEHKCHLIAIPPDEHGPGYVFSIGLYLHFAHPEFVLFGPDYPIAGTAINEISAERLSKIERGDGKFLTLDEVKARFSN